MPIRNEMEILSSDKEEENKSLISITNEMTKKLDNNEK